MSTSETCGPLYAQLDEAFQEGRSLEHVLGIIKGPLSRIALGQEKTASAYHHPLGFDTLISERGDYGVAIHWWPDGKLVGNPGRPLEDLHCHSFGLRSMSLLGDPNHEITPIW